MTALVERPAPPAPRRHEREVRRVLWALLLFEVGAILVLTHPWMAGDSRQYLDLARELMHGRYGVVRDGLFVPENLHPPGYPLFLAFLLHVAHLPTAVVVIVQALLYLASVWLLERLLVAHGMKDVSLVFLGAALAYPATIAHSTKLMSEGVGIFLVVAIVAVLARPGPLHHRHVAGAGALAGLAVLTRPTVVLLPVVLAVVVVLRLRPVIRWRRVLVAEALLFGVTAVVLAPYAVVNQRQLGRATVLPPAAAFGYSVYASTWSLEGRASTVTRSDEFKSDSERVNQEVEASIAREAAGGPELSADPGKAASQRVVRESDGFKKAALRRIREAPVQYSLHVAFNFWRLWNIADYPSGLPAVAKLLAQAGAAVIWALGMVGSVVLLLRRRIGKGADGRSLIAIPLTLLYFPAVLAWMESGSRYTAPGQLLLQLCAAVTVVEGWHRFAPASPTEHADETTSMAAAAPSGVVR